MESEIHAIFIKISLFCPILNQLYLVYSLRPYFSKTLFIIILMSTFSCRVWSLNERVSNENCICISHLPMPATFTIHLYTLCFSHSNDSVTILVIIEGVWISNLIYWALTTRNYKQELCSHCSTHFTNHYRILDLLSLSQTSLAVAW
jgi:hypothetical protein